MVVICLLHTPSRYVTKFSLESERLNTSHHLTFNRFLKTVITSVVLDVFYMKIIISFKRWLTAAESSSERLLLAYLLSHTFVCRINNEGESKHRCGAAVSASLGPGGLKSSRIRDTRFLDGYSGQTVLKTFWFNWKHFAPLSLRMTEVSGLCFLRRSLTSARLALVLLPCLVPAAPVAWYLIAESQQ